MRQLRVLGRHDGALFVTSALVRPELGRWSLRGAASWKLGECLQDKSVVWRRMEKGVEMVADRLAVWKNGKGEQASTRLLSAVGTSLLIARQKCARKMQTVGFLHMHGPPVLGAEESMLIPSAALSRGAATSARPPQQQMAESLVAEH